MGNNKSTDQPGSKDERPHSERTRNYEAHDSGGQRPNAEQARTNQDKSKQGQEEEHDPALVGKSTAELAKERGGHGHSGHSNSRNGSR